MFEENMGMRWLSRLLKKVARGRWWISRECGDDGAMVSFLWTATFLMHKYRARGMRIRDDIDRY